jgi:hypothetical protein
LVKKRAWLAKGKDRIRVRGGHCRIKTVNMKGRMRWLLEDYTVVHSLFIGDLAVLAALTERPANTFELEQPL